MAFRIERNDITSVKADAIVNDYGNEKLLNVIAERRKIRAIKAGQAVYTSSFGLKKNGVKYIIHTAGTFWQGGDKGEVDVIRRCYRSVFGLAKKLNCKSIALPLLVSENFGFPKDLCVKIATEEISTFVFDNEIDVILVVFDKKSFLISGRLFDDVKSFIDDNYVVAENNESDDFDGRNTGHFSKLKIHLGGSILSGAFVGSVVDGKSDSFFLNRASNFNSNDKNDDNFNDKLDKFLLKEQSKCSFQDNLLYMIGERNLANSTIYNKAGIDRRTFSKLINKKNGVPKKHIVMALGLALNLSLDEYEEFLGSAGYAFMPSDKFDIIVKYCVINHIYNIVKVNEILFSYDLECFAETPEDKSKMI